MGCDQGLELVNIDPGTSFDLDEISWQLRLPCPILKESIRVWQLGFTEAVVQERIDELAAVEVEVGVISGRLGPRPARGSLRLLDDHDVLGIEDDNLIPPYLVKPLEIIWL